MLARRSRLLRRRFVGFLAAALLLAQIAIAAAPCCDDVRPSPMAPGKTMPICHAGASESGAPTRHDHRRPDCAVCPLCLALAATAAFLTPAPVPPVPSFVVARGTTLLPPARAPPPRAVLATIYPTGPPILA